MFSLAGRQKLLDDIDRDPIVAHDLRGFDDADRGVAGASSDSFAPGARGQGGNGGGATGNIAKHYPEVLFRSQQRLLSDTVCSEFVFLREFFFTAETATSSSAGAASTREDCGDDNSAGAGSRSGGGSTSSVRPAYNNSAARTMFLAVFAKTLTFFREQTEDYLESCWDSVGALLMIRIVEYYKVHYWVKLGSRERALISPFRGSSAYSMTQRHGRNRGALWISR